MKTTTTRQRIGFVLLFVIAAVMLTVIEVSATTRQLTVDGQTYSPTKIVGNDNDPTVHYETPDTNPTAAFSDRHTWTGNGSDKLPCPYGIHWIDNKNELTVSHCLPAPDTTTTTEVTSSTTLPSDTTTTTLSSSTTTTPTTITTTSTSMPPSTTSTSIAITTTTVGSTTTTEPSTPTTTVRTPVEVPVAKVACGTVAISGGPVIFQYGGNHETIEDGTYTFDKVNVMWALYDLDMNLISSGFITDCVEIGSAVSIVRPVESGREFTPPAELPYTGATETASLGLLAVFLLAAGGWLVREVTE